MAITVFMSVYPRISIALFVIFLMVSYIVNLNLITKLYLEYQEFCFDDPFAGEEDANPEDTKLSRLQKHRISLDAILVFIAVAGLSNAYMTVQSDSFYLKNALSGMRVSSHRGNSHAAPENTLPALENAIIAGSDYAEIDVRQTKDGVLVLLHDSNLKRTAGLNRNIESLDLSELSKLDAGIWFSKDFAMTKIPSLEEAILLCKGRIKLNIEVKADQKGPMFEENLVTLIDQYDFEHQCIISSCDYDTLVKIKQLNANLKTGLILSAAYGNFYNKDDIDFFSIRSNHITRQVVENAHKAGKEIHAWTVNRVSEIERMKSIGVDCIITDNPTLAKKTLFEEDTGMSFFDLLNHLLSDS
jgi:glycerophosphoryl diester phosphodiesterase